MMLPSSSLLILDFIQATNGILISQNMEVRHFFYVLVIHIRFCNIRLSPVLTALEECKNGGFTLKSHPMFFVHTTLQEFKNAKIAGDVGFMFVENSVKKITRFS